jgi:hypothetical protein
MATQDLFQYLLAQQVTAGRLDRFWWRLVRVLRVKAAALQSLLVKHRAQRVVVQYRFAVVPELQPPVELFQSALQMLALLV